MFKLSKLGDEVFADAIAAAIGWAFLLAFPAGAFAAGRWAAGYLNLEGGRDAVGILSALAVIWMYERRDVQHRDQKLRDLIEAAAQVRS